MKYAIKKFGLRFSGKKHKGHIAAYLNFYQFYYENYLS